MVLLPLLFLLQVEAPDGRLLEAVNGYWSALVAGNRYGALEFVLEESRNDFILRRDPPLLSWKLLGIEQRSAGEALVRVEVEAFLGQQDQTLTLTSRDVWICEGAHCQVRISGTSPEKLMKWFNGYSQTQEAFKAGALQVYPVDRLAIHLLSRTQTGTLLIWNGTEAEVDLISAKTDPERFDILRSPGSILPHQSSSLELKYVGNEKDEELQSFVELLFSTETGKEAFRVPILYNHLSPGARWLMGMKQHGAVPPLGQGKIKPVIPDIEALIHSSGGRLKQKKPR